MKGSACGCLPREAPLRLLLLLAVLSLASLQEGALALSSQGLKAPRSLPQSLAQSLAKSRHLSSFEHLPPNFPRAPRPSGAPRSAFGHETFAFYRSPSPTIRGRLPNKRSSPRRRALDRARRRGSIQNMQRSDPRSGGSRRTPKWQQLKIQKPRSVRASMLTLASPRLRG